MRTLSKLAPWSAVAIATVVPAYAADYTIVLDKMKFGPVPAELHPGDTITWQNHDIFRHIATARDNSFDVDLPPKVEVKMVVGPAGSVDFFCKFHPGMTGILVITPSHSGRRGTARADPRVLIGCEAWSNCRANTQPVQSRL